GKKVNTSGVLVFPIFVKKTSGTKEFEPVRSLHRALTLTVDSPIARRFSRLRTEWLQFDTDNSWQDTDCFARCERLWLESAEIWDHHENDDEFSRFVAADYPQLFRVLLRYRDRITNFLEWGSGTGVATIMASLLGLDAYGIEIESGLVRRSRELATKYRS